MAPVEPWNGVAVREDAAVGRDQPVALTGRCRCHADDRLVEQQAARRAVELGVAEREDAAVGRDQPVAEARRCRGHADDLVVERDAGGRAVRRGVAGEDAAVGRDHPITGGRGFRGVDRRTDDDGCGGATRRNGGRGGSERGGHESDDHCDHGNEHHQCTTCLRHVRVFLVIVRLTERGEAYGAMPARIPERGRHDLSARPSPERYRPGTGLSRHSGKRYRRRPAPPTQVPCEIIRTLRGAQDPPRFASIRA